VDQSSGKGNKPGLKGTASTEVDQSSRLKGELIKYKQRWGRGVLSSEMTASRVFARNPVMVILSHSVIVTHREEHDSLRGRWM
jgi:hypothetical protein